MERRWSNFKESLKFYLSRKINTPLVIPDYFMISLTDNCTLSCKMCGCPQNSGRYKGEELSLSEIKDIIDQVYEWSKRAVVNFSGGEPFFKKEVLELIEYSCARGLKLDINTNGQHIDRSVAERISGCAVNHVTFSLDGDNAKANDSIRGEGVFRRALESIDNLNRAKAEFNKLANPSIGINFTIMRQNIRAISNMASLAREHGVSNIFFQPVVTDNTDLQRQKEFIFLGEEELGILIGALDKVKGEAVHSGIDISAPHPALLRGYFTEGGNKKLNRKWSCFLGYNRISVSSFGHVYSCFEENFGNIREQRLKDIWYSPSAREIRKKAKKCGQFCLQTCYARPESESLAALVKYMVSLLRHQPRMKKSKDR